MGIPIKKMYYTGDKSVKLLNFIECFYSRIKLKVRHKRSVSK